MGDAFFIPQSITPPLVYIRHALSAPFSRTRRAPVLIFNSLCNPANDIDVTRFARGDLRGERGECVGVRGAGRGSHRAPLPADPIAISNAEWPILLRPITAEINGLSEGRSWLIYCFQIAFNVFRNA